jgi:hypothetical protein
VRQTSCTYRCDPSHTAADLSFENDIRASEVVADAGPNGIRLTVPDLSDFMVSSSPTSVTFSKSGAPAAGQCAVTYRVSPVATGEAAIACTPAAVDLAGSRGSDSGKPSYNSTGYSPCRMGV